MTQSWPKHLFDCDKISYFKLADVYSKTFKYIYTWRSWNRHRLLWNMKFFIYSKTSSISILEGWNRHRLLFCHIFNILDTCNLLFDMLIANVAKQASISNKEFRCFKKRWPKMLPQRLHGMRWPNLVRHIKTIFYEKYWPLKNL